MKTTLNEAREFWNSFLELCDQQDERVLDLYSDDALIIEDVVGYKQIVKRGSLYREVNRGLLRAAKRRNEKIIDSTFKDVSFTEEGENVAINATRCSNLQHSESPFFLLLGKAESGRVVILEEKIELCLDRPLKRVDIQVETDLVDG